MKRELKVTENVLVIIGIAMLALILTLGGDSRGQAETKPAKNAQQEQVDQVCQVDGLECLFVGCNGFF